MSPSIRRELNVALRSFRLPGLAIALLFFALLDPPVIKYMNVILEQVGSASEIQITMPDPTPEMALTQFVTDIGGIGAFVAVIMFMGIVAAEKSNGVTEWVLTRPVTRSEYLSAKVLVWAIGVTVCVFGSGIIAWLYTWSLLGPVSFANMATALVAIIAYILFILAFTFAGSVVLNSQFAAGLVGMGAIFAGVFVNFIAKALGINRYLPSSAGDLAMEAVSGAISPVEIVPPVVCALVVAFLLLVYSYRRFARMEL